MSFLDRRLYKTYIFIVILYWLTVINLLLYQCFLFDTQLFHCYKLCMYIYIYLLLFCIDRHSYYMYKYKYVHYLYPLILTLSLLAWL